LFWRQDIHDIKDNQYLTGHLKNKLQLEKYPKKLPKILDQFLAIKGLTGISSFLKKLAKFFKTKSTFKLKKRILGKFIRTHYCANPVNITLSVYKNGYEVGTDTRWGWGKVPRDD